MPDLTIQVSLVNEDAGPGNFRVTIIGITDGFIQAGTSLDIAYGSNVAQINAAIIEAMVSTFAGIGVVIGPSDKKIILGGATVN